MVYVHPGGSAQVSMSSVKKAKRYIVDSREKAQRLRCPRGHSKVGPTNNHWLCRSCARGWDVDPEFEQIVDVKTGTEYTRDEVEFDSDIEGAYYA